MKYAALAVLTTLSLVACKPQDPKPLPAEVTAPAPAAAPAEVAPATDAAASTDAAPAEGVAADAAAAPTDAAPAVAAAVDGEAVYKKACITCHGAGIAGAPRMGDAADWGPRVAQGDAVLHEHAIKGFTGKKGMMPAKGGFVTLSDDEVKSAVDHMVAGSR